MRTTDGGVREVERQKELQAGNLSPGLRWLDIGDRSRPLLVVGGMAGFFPHLSFILSNIFHL